MKPLKITAAVLFVLFCCIISAAENSGLKPDAIESVYVLKPQPNMFTREKNTGTFTEKDGVLSVVHTGKNDFAVTLSEQIKVNPGDSFRISCKITNEGSGTAAFTVGMFDTVQKIISWTQGNVSVKGSVKEKYLEQEFVIPFGGAYILPRITGLGETKVNVRDYKLEKLDKVTLLNPQKELPATGKSFELLPAIDAPFAKALQFKGLKEFVNQRGRIPWSKVDEGLLYKGKATWKLAASDGLYFKTLPLEPFKCKAGEKVFISVRMYVERGKHSLAVYPWTGGLLGSEPFAKGTFTPAEGEETGSWCCIHSYITVPEGIDGLIPVIDSDNGGVYNVAEWKIATPSAEELAPKGKKVNGYFKERKDEVFDRGLTAIKTGNNIYLSWRLLKTDKNETAFDIYRIDAAGKALKVNQKPVKQTTDFIDSNVPAGDYKYTVQVSGVPLASNPSSAASVLDKPYRSIKLKDGVKSIASIAFVDLDGDGVQDFVIKTPNENIDPWYLYWEKSPSTYKLQGYKSDGTFLWEYDMGWGIERGIWYSPFIAADLDGDGCAEIVVKNNPGDFRNSFGRVYDGEECLSILNGKTGKERARIAWPERDGMAYNHSNRHQLCLAYLDGKTPCIIAERGTYDRMVAVAYQFKSSTDKNSPDTLEELWRYDNRWDKDKGRYGQGAHTTHAVDLDGDGRDEVILGSIALDDDSTVLWEQKLGHPDHVYVGDIDPSLDGLEVYLGMETGNPKNGMVLFEGKTGRILWGHDKRTYHIHSSGMASDIDPQHPGTELWSGEENYPEERFLRNCKGSILDKPANFPVKDLAPKSVWWTGELQRSLLLGSKPVAYPSLEPVVDTPFEGSIALIADLYGDWREEVVTSLNGEIRIYSTVFPAKDRRTTFLQDPNYRATLTESTMGYRQIPLPSLDLKKTAR